MTPVLSPLYFIPIYDIWEEDRGVICSFTPFTGRRVYARESLLTRFVAVEMPGGYVTVTPVLRGRKDRRCLAIHAITLFIELSLRGLENPFARKGPS